MRLSVLVAVLILVLSYLLRRVLPADTWLWAFGGLSLVLAFVVGGLIGHEETRTPTRAENVENALAVFVFLLAVLVPTVAMAIWFSVPVSPQRFSSLIGAFVLFEAYRLGNAAAHRLAQP